MVFQAETQTENVFIELGPCFFGAAADMDVRLPSPPEFEAGLGFGLDAVSFLKSAHRSSTLLFSSAAFNKKE